MPPDKLMALLQMVEPSPLVLLSHGTVRLLMLKVQTILKSRLRAYFSSESYS